MIFLFLSSIITSKISDDISMAFFMPLMIFIIAYFRTINSNSRGSYRGGSRSSSRSSSRGGGGSSGGDEFIYLGTCYRIAFGRNRSACGIICHFKRNNTIVKIFYRTVEVSVLRESIGIGGVCCVSRSELSF